MNSSRPYKGLSDLEYPFHDRTITVSNCGRICIGKRTINLSTVSAGQNVRIKGMDYPFPELSRFSAPVWGWRQASAAFPGRPRCVAVRRLAVAALLDALADRDCRE